MASWTFWKPWKPAPFVKLARKWEWRVALEFLLCVTDHCLPDENQHWVSPAYLARIRSGDPANCKPDKTADVRWFALDQLPANLTLTARNAIRAYARQQAPPGSAAAR